MKDNIPICVWRQVIEDDLEKIASQPNPILTFEDFNQHCYDCDGYDINCTGYLRGESIDGDKVYNTKPISI